VAVLCVPPLEEEPWPTLGPQVCDFIESYLVFGPGDLRGEPAQIDAEKRALIYRIYEVYPAGHPQAGRRRFKRVAISLRKGSAKTEFAAWIAACELHPEGPVRCDGFDAYGEPVGMGVTDPYVPMVAYTEEQSDELAYGALRVILEHSHLAHDFDIGLERILRIGGDGKAVSLASAPDARDGARTTWQHFDETHRFTLPRLKAAHRTMMANIPKRMRSDAWSLETTTAPAPGEGSVAEDTMDYARQVADGKISDSRLFFFHRQAGETHDLETPEGIRAAVIEASGPVAEWSDIDGIVEQWRDPTADRTYLERVWLNRLVRSSERAFDAERWKALADREFRPPQGDLITIGFDGARYHDSTALVATHVPSGYQWLAGLWEHPAGGLPHSIEGWEVPADEVNAVVADLFERFEVWRMYCDPPYWESYVAQWAGQYGDKRVLEWWTNRQKAVAYAIKGFSNAIASGEISHDGSAGLARHIGNACRRVLNMRDDQGVPLWMMYKERPDSPHKIDAAMAAVLSWEARNDAVASGVTDNRSVYEERGLLVL
jgi:phage terminase large subunit-like protein